MIKLILRFLFLTLLFAANNSFSQSIKGKVLDIDTREPLAFCNVYCKATNKGVVTDFNGEFELNAEIGSTISISFVGYDPAIILVKKKNQGKIFLSPSSIMIGEIKVIMKEDPAVKVMKKAIKRKDALRTEDTISTLMNQELTKVYLSDSTHKMIGFNKSSLFVEMTDSFPEGIPFFISDKRVLNDSLISKRNYGVGVESDFFLKFIDENLNLSLDIHDNSIRVFGRSIVSPISDNAFSFYKFYLIDTNVVNSQICYKVKVTKKRKRDAVFIGHVWVDTISFGIMQANIILEASKSGLNHLNGFSIYQKYSSLNNTRYESKNNIELTISTKDLPISDSILFRVKRNITRFEPVIDQIKEDSILRTDEFDSEIEIIDSLNNDSQIRFVTKLSETLISAYLPYKKIDIGPIYNTYSHNKVEGKRFAFLFRTNKNMFENAIFSNYFGYGIKDKRFKYGSQFRIRSSKESKNQFGLSYKNDLKPIGSNFVYESLFPNRFDQSGSDVLTSMLGGVNDDKMLYEQRTKVSFTHQWKKIEGSVYYSYNYTEKNPEVLDVKNDLHQNSIGLTLRYSRSKIVKNHFDKFFVPKFGNLFLLANLDFADKMFLSSTYNVLKARLVMRKNVNTAFFGRTRYLIDAGYYKVENNLSSVFLEIHRGNDSFVFDLAKSSLMLPYEFVSDRYIALYMDQHLNGRIFNNVPFIKKLELREVLLMNIVAGNIHNKSLRKSLPNFSSPLSYKDPYIEAGIGLENIFKFIRINAIWRLSHLKNKNISSFGIFGGFFFAI